MESKEFKDNLIGASPEELKKVVEFAKNKKLSDTLIKKPEFIKDVKEIFKSEFNIEVNDEDVHNLLQNIERAVRNEPLKTLDETELSEAVGGVSLKGFRDNAIIGVPALIGGFIGHHVGVRIGALGGARVGAGVKAVKNTRTSNKTNNDAKAGALTECDIGALTGAGLGAIAGEISGAAAGAAIGRKIVDFLNS